MRSPAPSDWLEDIASLLPALTLLQQPAFGYHYLSPAEALAAREGKRSRVVLDTVLATWLRANNHFTIKGQQRSFSDATIQRAVAAVSQHPFDALHTTSTALYDLLTLGKSFEETIDGDKKSFTLQFIDWQNPRNNVFYVTDEFEVERRGSTQTRRPDIVLFVNGIPLVVIECKRPDLKDAVKEAISQQLRNHRPDEIPSLFCLAQLLLAVSQNAAKYGTTATDPEFWAVWKEEQQAEQDAVLAALVNTPLSDDTRSHMLAWRESWQQAKMQNLWQSGERAVSAQDRALYSLLRPERLLELVRGFIVFDAGVKKIARYQQYFAIKAAVDRVRQVRGDERRRGGVIWHTTGSGKSLTMVMLAKALALEPSIRNPKIVLVNDRIDLDDQLKMTFNNCHATSVEQAQSGRHLIELVNLPKAEIITTVIDKFETVAREKTVNPSRDIFVLVDESHRSQYGKANALMQAVFPNACYIGFTGTPLLKKEKSTVQKFGGFIHSYTMPQAVADGAVVPLLYEGRDSAFRNAEAVDIWFERITRKLTDAQKLDLKRKFRSAEPLFDAEQRLAHIVYDIAQHFAPYVDTPFKAQFAVSSKAMAIKYKRLFDELADFSTAVLISPPDTREDNSSVDEANLPEVQRFWKDMMARYGSAERYQEGIIEAFKFSDDPKLIIVVDKLLTGFDAPRNRVLYLDKRLKEHGILQAIARVNRIFAGENEGDRKDFGLVVDYRGIFGELNDALELYAALEREGFDLEDVAGALTDVSAEIAKLPTRHASVWDVFKEVSNQQDTEAMQQHLAPQDRRDAFYEALQAYTKTLQLALGHTQWLTTTPDATQRRYVADLKYFVNLRAAIKQRYAESIDYSAYEAQLRTIIQQHIGAEAVRTLIEPVSIFQVDDFEAELETIEGTAAKADAIAARVTRVITERMEEDPTLYKRLSELIQEAIDAHRAKRLSDAEYLKRMREQLEAVRTKGAAQVPAALRSRDEARAYYGVLKERLADYLNDESTLATVACSIEDIITAHKVRDWQHNQDAQNRMLIDIDDLFHELRKATNVRIDYSTLDEVVGKVMNIAKVREG